MKEKRTYETIKSERSQEEEEEGVAAELVCGFLGRGVWSWVSCVWCVAV